MRFPAFLFETMDKIPSVEYMYLSGVCLAALVFAATYFHNQVGLITLGFVTLLSAQSIETPDIIGAVVSEAGENYIAHWYYSCRMTFVLSVLLFFTAVIIKRRKKRKAKFNENLKDS